MITHAGSLLPYTEFYRRVSSHMSLKEFRVMLKTTGCCYVVRSKILMDEEMWAKFKAKLEKSSVMTTSESAS